MPRIEQAQQNVFHNLLISLIIATLGVTAWNKQVFKWKSFVSQQGDSTVLFPSTPSCIQVILLHGDPPSTTCKPMVKSHLFCPWIGQICCPEGEVSISSPNCGGRVFCVLRPHFPQAVGIWSGFLVIFHKRKSPNSLKKKNRLIDRFSNKLPQDPINFTKGTFQLQLGSA